MPNKKFLAAASTCIALSFALSLLAAPDSQPAATQPAKKGRPKPAPKKPAPTWPDEAGYYNAAQTDLGASATGSGAPFDKGWPVMAAIGPETGKGRGTLIGNPILKARVDITLAAPVDIKAIETVGLDYNGTLQPKAIDIYVDDKMIQHAELPETPAQPVRTPLEAHGQKVSVVITDAYPQRALPTGKLGPNYGGWQRLRVLTPTNLASLMKTPAGYDMTPAPENITPTSGAVAEGKVEVFGEPRNVPEHPNTIWDQQDINHYKDMLKTSKELQDQLAALKNAMDLRLARPINIPQPQKNDQGEWRHISDAEPNIGKTHDELSLDIANLATVYVLTGEEKYADFAKKLFLAYADAYAHYVPGNRPGFAHDQGMIFDQRLGDAIWLIQLSRGYDLIHNLPSITPEERAHIENDLLKANAKFIAGNRSMLTSATNWSAIGTAAILITGYATDDQELINTGLYGLKGTKEKPTGGMYLHFSEKTIADDGMWSEGSTGYQFMAMEALLADAETLWHHGIDMYRYRDAALKRLFDSPLRYAYSNLQTPAISDGGGGSILASESNLWEFGYERYHDPQYLLILNQTPKTLRAEFQKFPVSVLFDRDASATAKPTDWKSINFFSVGFGILRLPEDPAMSDLTLLYGKAHSHGHPDKLSFDLYALGERFMFDPGSVWYEQPIYHQWYHTTLAHNTLVVDQQDQLECGATLLTYAPARTMGLERAATDQAYPGVTMDRSLFFTPNYLADIFGAFAQIPHTMDLSYHVMGDLKSTLKLAPYPNPEKLPNGYNVLGNLQHSAVTADPWSADIKTKKGVAHFFAADGTPTEVLIGEGHYGREHPPTVIERRSDTKATLFGNTVDISNAQDGYVKSTTLEGNLDKGYALLTVSTVKGDDLCFTSFRPGHYKAGDLETDAQQAFITRDGDNVRSMALAGGKSLQFKNASLSRSEPGLACVEQTASGNYIVSNPSPNEASITVSLPALIGLEAFQLDAQGKRMGPAKLDIPLGSFAVTPYGMKLAPLAQIEFAQPGAPSTYDAAQAASAKRMAAREADRKAAEALAAQRSKTRQTQAAAHPAPANTLIVIQAEDFSAQGNGEVKIADNKIAAVGKSVMNFNDDGQWLEWTAELPADGYYNLSICYATPEAQTIREISINGAVQEPLAPFTLGPTGGFANGADDWKLATASDSAAAPESVAAGNGNLLLKLNKGKNTIRLTNLGGRPTNLDYLLLTSPDVKPVRQK